jgi:precorrin-6B methylase 2
MLMHCLTGAPAIGIEIQPALAHASRELVQRMRGDRVSVIEGDAAELAQYMTIGSVFLLYCPFSGERLERVLDDLEPIARTRTIRVCTIDLPLPARSWLEPVLLADDLHVYRSI